MPTITERNSTMHGDTETFEARIKISRGSLAGMIVNALSLHNAVAREWSRLTGTYAVDVNSGVGVLFDGYVDLEGTINGGTYRLDRSAVERGIEIMAREAPRQFGRFLAGNADNATASVFLQCALLGEVAYA